MRARVIFNPVARGDKARHFRKHLDDIARDATLAATTCPGDARRLAAEAVREGCDTVIAAGGDGTLNEVLNGIGDVPGAFHRVRLGVLPLGTVNVFAKELGMPADLTAAWHTLLHARTVSIDLPSVTFNANGSAATRFFAQLAGAGFDARAIELTNWSWKKRVGPLAYVAAGLKCMCSERRIVTAQFDAHTVTADLILIGNGRLYGGTYPIFPAADMNDGFLELTVFEKVNWLALAQCGPGLLLRGKLPGGVAKYYKAKKLRLTSPGDASFQLDGELVGKLPAEFTILKSGLRVLVPAAEKGAPVSDRL